MLWEVIIYYRFCEKLLILINAHHIGQYFCFHRRSIIYSLQNEAQWNNQVCRRHPQYTCTKKKWAFRVLAQAEMGAVVFNNPLALAMLDTEQPFYRLGTGSSFHHLGSLWYGKCYPGVAEKQAYVECWRWRPYKA